MQVNANLAAAIHRHKQRLGEEVLAVEGVRKEFPGVVALDDVQLKVRAGTVHALMGENGAGKSTLMKIIAGIYTPDRGTIRLRGEEVTLDGPLDALEQGIAMIHQELNLMPFMTVAENIWIRREPKGAFGLIDHAKMSRMTRELFDRLKIRIDPEVEVRTLTVAARQMVEIADEVSVFRDGRYIGTRGAGEVTRDDIIRMMVGREITNLFPKEEVPIGETVLEVRGLSLSGVFHDMNFTVRAGEILGLAGLVGSGRSNVAEALFGVTPATSGTISIRGEEVAIRSPVDAMRHGMAFLTEDRKETGCFLSLEVLENMQIAVLQESHVRLGFVEQTAVNRRCEEMKAALRIKTPTLHERIENLSGGNQQKVLIARWLLTKPRILILDEPTRGIDVGAKAEIHRLISALARDGVAVVMISSELPEVLGMSDRILVMHEGHQTGILDRAEADQVRIMELAAR
jgi:inositol transport system ATP-binding protein